MRFVWPSPGGTRFWQLLRVDPLQVGIIVSIGVHLVAMMVQFRAPEPIRFLPQQSRLDMVLLNAGTPERPLTPEVVAQVNSIGGGEHDAGRATSPLPAEARVREGSEVLEAETRRRTLEAEQRRLIALSAAQAQTVQPSDPVPEALAADGADEVPTQQAIARLQAQIERQLQDYNRRPRRLTYGVNAIGADYALYVDRWTHTIERIGTARIPQEARGRMYDSLVITVELDFRGNVVDVIINRASKYPLLNRLIREIVYAGAPYPAFPSEMRRNGDILQIVRTWNFTAGTLQTGAPPLPNEPAANNPAANDSAS